MRYYYSFNYCNLYKTLCKLFNDEVVEDKEFLKINKKANQAFVIMNKFKLIKWKQEYLNGCFELIDLEMEKYLCDHYVFYNLWNASNQIYKLLEFNERNKNV